MWELFRGLFAPPRDMILPLGAVWLGLLLAERRASRHGIGKEALNNLVFFGLITFVLSGRLIHALLNLSAYTAKPLDLFSILPQQFNLPGALAGALITGFVICRRLNLITPNVLDALTPFFSVFAVGLALMHLANGSAYGQPSLVPWAVELAGTFRHPSQVYETLAAIGILLLIAVPVHRLRPGLLFLLFSALTAGARLFLEAFRGDSALLPGGFRQAQAAALAVLLVSLVLMELIINRESPVDINSPGP